MTVRQEDDPDANPTEPHDELGEVDPPVSTVEEPVLEDQDDPPVMVPQARLDQEIEKTRKAERAADRYRGRVDALSAQPAPAATPSDEPKKYTRGELRELVESGRMTSDQMEDRLDEQRDLNTASLVQSSVASAVRTTTLTTSIESQYSAYTEARPDVLVEGAADRDLVQQEYDFLVSQGDDPDALTTQVKAMRSAFGPIDTVSSKPGLKVVQKKESHVETSSGGGGGGSRSKEANTSKAPADLSTDETAYYTDLIQRGIYAGWPDVHEEMKHSVVRTRTRAKARG